MRLHHRWVVVLGLACAGAASGTAKAGEDRSTLLAVTRLLHAEFDRGDMEAVAGLLKIEMSQDRADFRAIGVAAFADRIYALRGKAWEYGQEEDVPAETGARRLCVRVGGDTVVGVVGQPDPRRGWRIQRIEDVKPEVFVPRTPPAVDPAGPAPGEGGGPAAGLRIFVDGLRSGEPDAWKRLLWTRWGDWSMRTVGHELDGDVGDLSRALHKSSEAASIVVREIHGSEPTCLAACRLQVGARVWRVVLVEEDGWKVVRTTEVPPIISSPSSDGAAIPSNIVTKIDVAARAVLDAIIHDDFDAFSACMAGAVYKGTPLRIDDIRSFWYTLRRPYGSRTYRLGAIRLGISPDWDPYHVSVLFGDHEATLEIGFGETGGKFYPSSNRWVQPADFIPREK